VRDRHLVDPLDLLLDPPGLDERQFASMEVRVREVQDAGEVLGGLPVLCTGPTKKQKGRERVGCIMGGSQEKEKE
jgi:hypothetical protein